MALAQERARRLVTVGRDRVDGAIVVGVGRRDGAPTPSIAPPSRRPRALVRCLRRRPRSRLPPLFPTVKGPVAGLLQTDSAVPALLAPDSAALIGEETPKKPFVFYGGTPGADAVAPLKLPSGEKIVPVPYGRPPTLLSIKGRDLVERPFPARASRSTSRIRVPGLVSTPTLFAELSAPPACETAGWSFQRVKQPKSLVISSASPRPRRSPSWSPRRHRAGDPGGLRRRSDRRRDRPRPRRRRPGDLVHSSQTSPRWSAAPLRERAWYPAELFTFPQPGRSRRSAGEIAMASTEQGILGVDDGRAPAIAGASTWPRAPVTAPCTSASASSAKVRAARGRIGLGALVSFGKQRRCSSSAERPPAPLAPPAGS